MREVREGACLRCGRMLKNPIAIAIRYGRICAAKEGIPFEVSTTITSVGSKDTLPMSLSEFSRYEYKGFGDCKCLCGLRVYKGPIVITTEIPENKGTSIFNAAELLYKQLSTFLKRDFVYIQQGQDGDFSEVRFDTNGKPYWVSMKEEALKEMIGGAL